MEKAIILFKPHVLDIFEELIYELYLNDYFSSYESAFNYKENIIVFIRESIYTFPASIPPFQLSKYGDKYIFYNSNKRTTWNIFFKVINNAYIITHILIIMWL